MKKVILAICMFLAITGASMAQTTPAKEATRTGKHIKKHAAKKHAAKKHHRHMMKKRAAQRP